MVISSALHREVFHLGSSPSVWWTYPQSGRLVVGTGQDFGVVKAEVAAGDSICVTPQHLDRNLKRHGESSPISHLHSIMMRVWRGTENQAPSHISIPHSNSIWAQLFP